MPNIPQRNGDRGMPVQRQIANIFPGLILSAIVAGAGFAVEKAEVFATGFAWFESLVLAILIGTLVRTVFGLHPRFEVGVKFSGKILLEIAIVLLGASISLSALKSAGIPLVAGVAGSVLVAVALSYTIGRTLKLEHKLALLVACGNSICGNSAIVAVAPVLEAEAEDVAASIAFTAALGIAVVLALPLSQHLTGMSAERFGILSGMTVYAVPQVLAATAPAGAVALQTGTLVKLIRVMMLAPVIFLTGLFQGRRSETPQGQRSIAWRKFVPWFIIGFVFLMTLRSYDLIPAAMLAPMSLLATMLTIISMAALGLSVDMRTIMHSGCRVLAAGTLSIFMMGGLAMLLLSLLHIG
jgi:uncharacterized integral membrane protein (TIGR00698 family)